MAFSQVGSGYLFRNKNKKSDKQPEFRGKGNVTFPGSGEMEFQISAWVKEKDGDKYFSFSFSAEDEAAQAAPAAADDDDVPF